MGRERWHTSGLEKDEYLFSGGSIGADAERCVAGAGADAIPDTRVRQVAD